MPSPSRPAEPGRLTRGAIVADLRTRAFARAGRRYRIGAEIELIPIDARTGRIAPIRPGACPATLPVLRRAAEGGGWREGPDPFLPRFEIPSVGEISFEPGGQVEFSSVPHATAGSLIRSLTDVIGALQQAFTTEGIELLEVGIDPLNPLSEVPLQLTTERYRRMDAHFAREGPSGARMMRQTASLQISVDWAADVALHWRTLNAAVPYLVAIFANSSRYRGADTGARSFRALTWTRMDPLRTGVLDGLADPAEEYATFALAADAVLLGAHGEPTRPLSTYLGQACLGLADWHTHLTTLFPDVRPRGEFVEVRCLDALPSRWYAAPLAVLTGLTDSRALQAAADLLGPPRRELVPQAALHGLGDAEISETARALYLLALEGAESVGAPRIDLPTLTTAWSYFDRFTRLARSPADEASEPHPRSLPDTPPNPPDRPNLQTG